MITTLTDKSKLHTPNVWFQKKLLTPLPTDVLFGGVGGG